MSIQKQKQLKTHKKHLTFLGLSTFGLPVRGLIFHLLSLRPHIKYVGVRTISQPLFKTILKFFGTKKRGSQTTTPLFRFILWRIKNSCYLFRPCKGLVQLRPVFLVCKAPWAVFARNIKMPYDSRSRNFIIFHQILH